MSLPTLSVKRTIEACCPSALKPALARIEASDIGYRLAKGTFWIVAGGVISRGLGILASVVVARTLGKGSFGELGIINSTVGLFQVFAGFGLGLTATKYVAEYRTSNPQKAGRIISLGWMVSAVTGGLCAILLATFAPWLAAHALAAPHLSGLLRVASIALLISSLNAAQNGALSGFEAFKTIAGRSLIAGVLNFPIMIAGVLLDGLQGAVWATVVSCAINWFICHLAVRREAQRYRVPLTFTGCWEEAPLLWKFSLPAVLSGIMVTPVTWACSALLVNQPNGYDEMGIFSAANQWYTLVLFLPSMLGTVVLPILAERLGQKEIGQSRKLLALTMKVNAILVLPVVLVAGVASPYIMGLYGADFKSGWPTLIVVLLTAGVLAIQTPVGQIIAASGKMWTGFLMNLGWALVFVFATLVSTGFGSLGLASARAAAYLVHAIWVLIFARVITSTSCSTITLRCDAGLDGGTAL